MIDFEPTETQRQVVDMARRFGEEVLRPAEVALDAVANPDEMFASDRYRRTVAQAYELGFHRMALPEEHGGLGFDPVTTGMVWEELSRWGAGFAAGLMSVSVVPQLIAFLAPGNTGLVEKYVTPHCADATGTSASAWGSSEPNVGADGSNYYDPTVRHHTTAEKIDGGWRINGTKSNFISNGGRATVFVVFANVDPSLGIRGSGAFVVPGDAKGVSRGTALDKVGLRTLNQCPVFFDDVEIPEDYMIFPPGEGYPMLHNAIHTVGNLGVGYLAVGVMRAAYEEALAYSKERVQWGRPIFQHELIAAKLFCAYQAIESARAFLQKGSWHSKKAYPGDLKTSLAARVYATREAVRHTVEMVQVLGAYGISKEYPVEKYMRDAKLLELMDGANEILMLKAAALL